MLTFVQGDTVGKVKERMQERLGVNDKVPFNRGHYIVQAAF